MSNKRVNPRRRPATMADVKRAADRASDDASAQALGVFLWVLGDKHGLGAEEMQKLYAEIQYACDSISEGLITVPEILQVLKEEYGVHVVKGKEE